MNAIALAQYLQEYANETTDFDKDYLLHAAQILVLQTEEIRVLKAKFQQEFEYAENLLKAQEKC
jgi:hypothetical protein